MEKRRGPGRPAYDSKQKLVDAACALLAERGFEATSPQMFQQRCGVGHGSMYHHIPGKRKEGLVLDTISHLRASTLAFLDGTIPPEATEPEIVRESIVAALDRLFSRKEGHALVRLLADAVAGGTPSLATAVQDWCEDSRAAIIVKLRADEPGDNPDAANAAARLLAPEFDTLADELFMAALGRGLLGLPSSLDPDSFAQGGVDPLPGPVIAPEPEIVIDRLPWRELMRQGSPGDAPTQHIEHGVEQLPAGVRRWPTTRRGCRDERFDDRPLGVSEVGW